MTVIFVVGVAVGVIVALCVEEPEYQCALAAILCGEYECFELWGKYALLIVLGVICGYVGLHWSRPILLWLYMLAAGYAWGRGVCLSIAVSGGIGVANLAVVALPLAAVVLASVITFYVQTADIILVQWNPKCNPSVTKKALLCIAVGVAVCFVYAVCILGLANMMINIV